MAANEALQKTIDRYHELIRLTPNDAGLVTNLAWSYERAKEYPEAIQAFRRALELNSSDHNIFFGLGLAQMGQGDFSEARKSFGRAEELARNSADRSAMAIISQQVASISKRLG